MIWNERAIARALARQTFHRKYLVVVPNCMWTGHECDLLVVTENLRVVDVEIKISRADLKADAAKAKWWHRFGTAYKGVGPDGRAVYETPTPDALEWPRRVWKHYYALPADIWTPDLLAALPSPHSGVILLKRHNSQAGNVIATVERRATPNREAKPISPAAAIDIARLASLRMWQAYEAIDAIEAPQRAIEAQTA